MPLKKYDLDYGYVCSKCKYVFETYDDCLLHVSQAHGERDDISIWSYDKNIYKKYKIFNKFEVKK